MGGVNGWYRLPPDGAVDHPCVMSMALSRKCPRLVQLQAMSVRHHACYCSESFQTWKSTSVVSNRVGGIPLQIIDTVVGSLGLPLDTQDCAERARSLLRDLRHAKEMGSRGESIPEITF